jgi:hypothetical protein
MSTHFPTRIAFHLAIPSLLAAALSACGGGSSDPSSAAMQSAASGGSASGMQTALSVSAASAAAAGTTAPAAGTQIATEGGSFTVTGTQTVQFGAGTSWVTKTVTGTGQCTTAFFGSDPDFGTVKSCQLVSAAPTVTTVASEGQSFTVTGTQTVQFGAGSQWITKSITGTGQCTTGFFGSDPAFGTFKSCQVITTTAVAAPTPTPATPTTVASEGQSFAVTGTQTVRFGADTRWITMSVTGTGQCTNAFFGSDPAFGTAKTCQVMPTATPAPTPAPTPTPTPTAPAPTASAPAAGGATVTAWVRVGNLGDTMNLSSNQLVRFGDGYKWVTATLANGAACTPNTFGNDPAPWTPEFCETQVTAPTVVQTGTAPVINTALLPAAAGSFSTARVRTLSAAELASANFQPVAADVGAFRDPCSFSHMSFDDPIVYPGKPGLSHLHTFVGNDQLSASSTTASIAGTGGSTCGGGTLNRTGYWMPTVVDTRTGQPLAPIDANMYYKVGYMGVPAATIKPFPQGLRIIAGTASATAAIPSLARFACMSGGPWQSSIPSCAAGDILMASVTFPQCWDGVNLDSPDHKSHMAYGTGTGCPADHPVALPEISIRFDYKVAEANSGNFLKLSSDNYAGPGGFSLHADWFGGWDTSTMNTFVTNCLNKSMDCHDNLLGDGRTLY